MRAKLNKIIIKEKLKLIKEIEKSGTIIHKGELPHSVYGLLIDMDKIKDKYIKLLKNKR